MKRSERIGKGAFSTPGMSGGEVGPRRANLEQGAWITYQLKRLGVSQRALGHSIGVSQQMVQRVAYGVSTSARVQKAIARALGYRTWAEVLARCTDCEGAAA